MPSAKMTARDVKRLHDLLDWVDMVAGGGLAGGSMDAEWAAGESRHARLATTPRRKPSRPSRAPGRSVEQRRDERRKRMADIREAVMVRADGRCECCYAVAPLEAHHVAGGASRRSSESFETLAGLCRSCHAGVHAGNELAIKVLAAWARRHGYRVAAFALEKRLDKINAAARATRSTGGR